jgi:hypothetical protein
MDAGYEEQEGQYGELHHASVGLEELKHQKSFALALDFYPACCFHGDLDLLSMGGWTPRIDLAVNTTQTRPHYDTHCSLFTVGVHLIMMLRPGPELG